MSQDQPVRWRAVPGDALAWREWGAEFVVFNQETGSTHLLGELAGEVLRRLVAEEEGATVDALVATVSDEPGSAGDPDWTKVVAEVLTDFKRLGLARPVAP